ncbi:MAG: hypothetical protein JXA25_13020 [Anaerolineales bacterium]|nr:hypothetical protein [Anaerolineales bacterium]
MKRRVTHFPIYLLLLCLSAGFFSGISACSILKPSPSSTTGDGITNRWAVLFEKDGYDDVGMTNLPVDYISMNLIEALLLESGWELARIHSIPEFSQKDFVEELNWLEDQTDADDLIFVYVAAHGRYLSHIIQWEEVFPPEWENIRAEKILLVDACEAGKFIKTVEQIPGNQIVIGAVQEYEYGWCGLEDEGLPIIGFVYTHYFSQAFTDSGSDADKDGFISVQEAALWAEEQQRDYMHEVVFEVPEFAEDYRELGIDPENSPDFPHTVLSDTIGEPVILSLDVSAATSSP